MPIYTYQGAILRSDGAIATNANCCCVSSSSSSDDSSSSSSSSSYSSSSSCEYGACCIRTEKKSPEPEPEPSDIPIMTAAIIAANTDSADETGSGSEPSPEPEYEYSCINTTALGCAAQGSTGDVKFFPCQFCDEIDCSKAWDSSSSSSSVSSDPDPPPPRKGGWVCKKLWTCPPPCAVCQKNCCLYIQGRNLCEPGEIGDPGGDFEVWLRTLEGIYIWAKQEGGPLGTIYEVRVQYFCSFPDQKWRATVVSEVIEKINPDGSGNGLNATTWNNVIIQSDENGCPTGDWQLGDSKREQIPGQDAQNNPRFTDLQELNPPDLEIKCEDPPDPAQLIATLQTPKNTLSLKRYTQLPYICDD